MNTNNLNVAEFKGFLFIRDQIIYRGKTPTLREIAKHLGFKSPRSAMLLLKRLEEKKYIAKTPGGNIKILKDISGKNQTERTIEIPLVGSAPCGAPFLAEENVEAMVPVSQVLARPGAQYFLLHAVGNSMDEAGINSGDLMLVRIQPVAEEGQRVVALIGNEVTVKEFHRDNNTVVLKPRSSDKTIQPIILSSDFMIQGVVVGVIKDYK
jgi:repressor LexA